MIMPHLLWISLHNGLSLRFECLSPGSPDCATRYDNPEPPPEQPEIPEGEVGAIHAGGPAFPRFFHHFPQFFHYDNNQIAYTPMSSEQRATWNAYWQAEEAYEPWAPKLDECWVETKVLHHVTNTMSEPDFLEDLGDVGPVTGPLLVDVWDGGDIEACVPTMRL